jgi:hypothetical protein
VTDMTTKKRVLLENFDCVLALMKEGIVDFEDWSLDQNPEDSYHGVKIKRIKEFLISYKTVIMGLK